MEKLDIGKVKTTRLLDKLEAKQLIERKRRGMNNIVVLRVREGELVEGLVNGFEFYVYCETCFMGDIILDEFG